MKCKKDKYCKFLGKTQEYGVNVKYCCNPDFPRPIAIKEHTKINCDKEQIK